MNLKIKLVDPKFCNSCPCLQYRGGWSYSLGKYYCGWTGNDSSYKDRVKDIYAFVLRPEQCIKENGI